MRVSKRSWHYRLYRYTGNIPKGPRYLVPWTKAKRTDVDPPTSLCPYAWSIFLGLVGTAALVAVATPLAIAVAPFYLALRALLWADQKVGLARIRATRSRREKPRPEPPSPPTEKHPSLLAEFLKAKKERVCPPIELVD